MQMEAKISIIVAVYNIEQYLRRCLDSIVSQTYRELEIITVDDGSTDGSGAICDEYAEKDARIKVIHRENGGLSAAWNTGLSVASGAFLGFVDGDDFIEPTMYEAMLAALHEHQAEIAVCNHRQWGSGRNDEVFSNKAYPFRNITALERYVSADKRLRILPTVWSKLFKRDVVEGLSFTAGKTSQDVMYTTKAFCKASRVVYLDQCLYNYNVGRPDSITNKKKGERRLAIEVPVWKEQIEYLQANGYAEIAEKAAYHFYRQMLFYFIGFKMANEKKAAKRAIEIVKAEKNAIKKTYHHQWVKTGDKARMKTFLFWPQLYYLLVRLDEKTLIPIRARFQK